jgi:hypothetical protein
MSELELREKIRQAEINRDTLLKQKKPIDLQLYQARKLFRLYSEQLNQIQAEQHA